MVSLNSAVVRCTRACTGCLLVAIEGMNDYYSLYKYITVKFHFALLISFCIVVKLHVHFSSWGGQAVKNLVKYINTASKLSNYQHLIEQLVRLLISKTVHLAN